MVRGALASFSGIGSCHFRENSTSFATALWEREGEVREHFPGTRGQMSGDVDGGPI